MARHSQPKWHCHFVSSILVADRLKKLSPSSPLSLSGFCCGSGCCSFDSQPGLWPCWLQWSYGCCRWCHWRGGSWSVARAWAMLLRSRGASVLLSSHDFSGHRGMKWPSSRCKKIGMVLRGFLYFDACGPWRWYPAQALVTTLVTEVCVVEGGFNATRGLVQKWSLTRSGSGFLGIRRAHREVVPLTSLRGVGRSGLSWAGGCGCCRHEWLLQAGATKRDPARKWIGGRRLRNLTRCGWSHGLSPPTLRVDLTGTYLPHCRLL